MSGGGVPAARSCVCCVIGDTSYVLGGAGFKMMTLSLLWRLFFWTGVRRHELVISLPPSPRLFPVGGVEWQPLLAAP